MKNLDHPLAPGLVHIHDTQGEVIGAGFLAAKGLICTCAHVVADALHISRHTQVPPSAEIQADFPYLNEAPASVAIVEWHQLRLMVEEILQCCACLQIHPRRSTSTYANRERCDRQSIRGLRLPSLS